ncbi:MAG: PEP-CTERM sorting domain-containing protein [Acidobacteriaceae bacterium]|nr:PEP-CTERM sorting domain-containing protein [Acidobacteriaceae bacterium]
MTFGLAATAMTAFATPVCSSNVTDNGSTYFGGGYSCTVGDLLFSNFSYTGSGTNPISASQITVDTVSNDGIGLSFHAPWSAGAGMTTDGTIDFTVTVLGGGSLLEDFGLAQTSGVSGSGSASVAEDGCGPAPCLATGGSIYVLTFQDSGERQAQGETTFAPVNSVSVEKDISVNGNSGFATISVVQDTFSQVPEPVSMGMMGGGLALLGLVRLRRRAKA